MQHFQKPEPDSHPTVYQKSFPMLQKQPLSYLCLRGTYI